MQNYVGQQIDRYRITERLGMGGMAVVYKAYDTRLERDVALKLIRVEEIPPSQHERLMKRFEREAKAMARFSHPNIVPVYDYGEVDGSPYLVMEYIPGGTLKDKTGQPMPVETAIGWITPIADALAYAHEFGIIHRDVKPSNILFDQKGRPILTDFGIAKVIETDEATLTGTGLGVGTPEYMAPEQWRGKTCPATDQYALGVVLYELLTGRKPYTADTPAALVILQATEPLPQPSKLVKGIPEEVEKVLYKALARDPEDRYENLIVFRSAIENLLLDEEHAPLSDNSYPQIFSEGFTEKGSNTNLPSYEFPEEQNTDHGNNNWSTESEINHSNLASGSSSRSVNSPSEPETFDELTPQSQIDSHERDSSVKHPGEKNAGQSGPGFTPAAPRPTQPDPNKTVRKKLLFVIGLISVIGITVIYIIAYIISNSRNKADDRADTMKSDQTATSIVEATQSTLIDTKATEVAQETFAAKSQATAAAQVVWDTYNKYLNNSNLVYEMDGFVALEHEPDEFLEVYWTHQELKNFAMEIIVQNPYGPSIGDWDFGILFRHAKSNDQYRLSVNSNGYWQFKNMEEGAGVSVIDGFLDVNTGEGDENFLQVLAVDDKGWFFFNGQIISELDLSERDFSGEIGFGIEFYGYGTEGYSTTFTDLVVYTTEKSGIPLIQIEEKDGMNYFRVVDEKQDLDYTLGPVSSNKISDYKITVSPSNRCFAFIVGSTVYYSVIGESSLYIAGDISNFLIIQEGGSGESEFIDLLWAEREGHLVVGDTSRGYVVSEFYASFPISHYDQCFGE